MTRELPLILDTSPEGKCAKELTVNLFGSYAPRFACSENERGAPEKGRPAVLCRDQKVTRNASCKVRELLANVWFHAWKFASWGSR